MHPSPKLAENLATTAHAGQLYDDKIPYIRHPGMVVAVLERFGITRSEMVCGGWCHDVIEDSRNSYNDVKKELGAEVAELVYAVTSELGRDRKERNQKTYGKIRASRDALILKLADRIANLEYSSANGGKAEMYRAEFPEFYDALYRAPDQATPDGQILARMWAHVKLLLKVE